MCYSDIEAPVTYNRSVDVGSRISCIQQLSYILFKEDTYVSSE